MRESGAPLHFLPGLISSLSALILLTLVLPQADAEILHLELGAANYKATQGKSDKRFQVLDHSLQELVKSYGGAGTIYLNDIEPDGLRLAKIHVQTWCKERGLEKIKVIAVAENYRDMDIPYVKTANLSNPGENQLPKLMSSKDGSAVADFNNIRLVEDLERIAAHSETGLKITSYYVPAVELSRGFLKNSELVATGEYGPQYHSPSGGVYETTPSVFYLKSRSPVVIPRSESLSARGSTRSMNSFKCLSRLFR